jgi:hypothetical protein
LRMYPVGSGGSGGRRRAADVAHFVLLHSCEVYESVPELVLTQGGPQPGPAHCKFAPTVPKKKKKLVPRALLRRNEMGCAVDALYTQRLESARGPGPNPGGRLEKAS